MPILGILLNLCEFNEKVIQLYRKFWNSIQAEKNNNCHQCTYNYRLSIIDWRTVNSCILKSNRVDFIKIIKVRQRFDLYLHTFIGCNMFSFKNFVRPTSIILNHLLSLYWKTKISPNCLCFIERSYCMLDYSIILLNSC